MTREEYYNRGKKYDMKARKRLNHIWNSMKRRCYNETDIMKQYWEHRQVAEWLEKLKEYEQAEEDGLLIRLPVAEGSEVYVIDYVYECKYEFECPLPYNEYKCEEELPCENQYKRYRVRETKFNHMMLAKIGKTVFLSKAEAEQALAKMKGV